jgi:hypothetical protein
MAILPDELGEVGVSASLIRWLFSVIIERFFCGDSFYWNFIQKFG